MTYVAERVVKISLYTLFFAILFYSFKISKVNPIELVSGVENSIEILKEMMPPDFSNWRRVFLLSLETIAIGWVGTIFGILLSIPMGFLSAKNLSPNLLVYNLSRALVNFIRVMPDIFLAILLVISFGMGPVPGIFALSISTVGLLAKFFSESLESIDMKLVEALKATGSKTAGVIRYAVLPQVAPLFTGYSLYLLDHNIRVAMVLGLVGAGGLGVELYSQTRSFNYQQVGFIIIVVYLIITIVDRVSAKLREYITYGKLSVNSLLVGLILQSLMALFVFLYYSREVQYNLSHILPLLSGLLKPDFGQFNHYAKLMVETVGMAISSTFLAVLISVPLGILISRNIIKNKVIEHPVREVVNFLRAMPELVFALLFVSAIGLGPFAGVLAIALHTVGFLAKMYSEAIENINNKPVEALEAVGADKIHTIKYAVFPQILPLFNSYNLYILDRNVRAATTMGVVGAGGIGFELVTGVKFFDFPSVATIFIIVIAIIVIIDYVSAYLRSKMV